MKFYIILFLANFLTGISYSTTKQELSDDQRAGKVIYENGLGSQKIIAKMSGVEVPASVITCVNCHGKDGTGNAEGGIAPSNIQWSSLTKSYGGKRINGNSRSAYTESSLRKVITTGIDPSGNQLHKAMPTFNMSRKDIDNLIEYIKIIEFQPEIGVSDKEIRIGLLIDNKSENRERNIAAERMSKAYAEYVNKSGGIYGRNLEINIIDRNVSEEINKQFIVSAVHKNTIPSGDNIPNFAVYDFSKKTNLESQNFAFTLYPDLVHQSRSLLDFSINNLSKRKEVTILFDEKNRNLAESIASKGREALSIAKINSLSSEFNRKHEIPNKASSILCLCKAENLEELLSHLDQNKRYPNILIVGAISMIPVTKVPLGFRHKIHIAYPNWPTSRSEEGILLYKYLSLEANLPVESKNLQMDFLSLLIIITETLKKNGHQLSREGFVSQLENTFQLSTGLGPTVSFDLNNHVASSSVFIVNQPKDSAGYQLNSIINISSAK